MEKRYKSYIFIGVKENVKVKVMSQDSLEKSQGEGSGGGKIIGHTKSGKPIYDSQTKDSKFDKDHLGYSMTSKSDAR